MTEIIPPEVCSWMCKSVLGQIAILTSFLLTVWQEFRYHRNKNKRKIKGVSIAG